MNTQEKEMKVMEAMNGIRAEYLEEADFVRNGASTEASVEYSETKDQEDSKIVDFLAAKNNEEKKAKKHKPIFYAKIAAAAAAVALSIILPNTNVQVAYAMQNIPVVGAYFKLVTFRDYSYEDAYHDADVKVSGVTVDSNKTNTSVAKSAERSAAEINKDIKATTDAMIKEFQESLKEEGYSNLKVSTETVTDNEKWYVLKLSSFQAAASGYEQNRYYVIDKATGKRVELSDLFRKGSDYRKVISEEIIRQMKKAEAADPDTIHYWIDEKEDPSMNFKEISQHQQFYINSKNQLVIAFQEGDVGPMSMGVQNFVIPESVIHDVLDTRLLRQ